MKENQQAIELIQRLFNLVSFYRRNETVLIDEEWAGNDWKRNEVWRDAKAFLKANSLNNRRKALKEYVENANPTGGQGTLKSLLHGINCTIEKYCFDTQDFSLVGKTERGTSNFNLGEDTFLCISWYRMQSGNFEIVAYTS